MPPQKTSHKKTIFTVFVIILLAGAAFLYFTRPDLIPFVSQTGTSTPRGFSFNPFNRPSTNQPNTNQPATTTNNENPYATSTGTITIPRLRHIFSTPHAGAYATSTATTTFIRFVDKGNGHVYEAASDTLALRKLSNTTIPRAIEAVWNTDGTGLTLRYDSDETGQINTFYASIVGIHLEGQKKATTTAVKITIPAARATSASSTASSTNSSTSSTTPTTTTSTATSTSEIPGTLKGQYLSANLTDTIRSPKGNALAVVTKNSSNITVSTYELATTLKKDVHTSPFSSWNIEWPEQNTLIFTTKPTAISSGFAYTLDLRTGVLQKILGGIRGLDVKMNASSTKLLYSSIAQNGKDISMKVMNIKDATTQDLVFRTLPEKCIWSNLRSNELICAVPSSLPQNAQLPDDWYLGKVSFTDQLWHFDTETGEVHLLSNLIEEARSLIDATDLVLDQKERFLLFTNKYDGSLWSLDLTE